MTMNLNWFSSTATALSESEVGSLSIICYAYYLLGAIGLLSALVVASSLNPIHRIAFLILVFLCGAGLMIIYDFYFLGLTYIIVYVGAIMILFLFVIMMVQIHLIPSTLTITPRIINSSTNTARGANLTNSLALSHNLNNAKSLSLGLAATKPLQLCCIGLLFVLSIWGFMKTSLMNNNMIVNYFYTAWSIEFKTLTDIESLANILYIAYPSALLIIGIALWVVMVGIIKVTMSENS